MTCNWRQVLAWNVFEDSKFESEFAWTAEAIQQGFSFPEHDVFPVSIEGKEDTKGYIQIEMSNADIIRIDWDLESEERPWMKVDVNGEREAYLSDLYFTRHGIPEFSELAKYYAMHRGWA